MGAGRGHRVVFGIILGTGVGGGLVDRRPARSTPRAASPASGGTGRSRRGSPATPPVEIPRFACGCGLAGCLDATVSARGMEKLHRLPARRGGDEPRDHRRLGARRGRRPRAPSRSGSRSPPAPLAMLVNVTAADIIPAGGGLGGSAPLIAALDAAVRRLTHAPLRPAAGGAGAVPGRAGAGRRGLARLCPPGGPVTQDRAAMKINYTLAADPRKTVDGMPRFRAGSRKRITRGCGSMKVAIIGLGFRLGLSRLRASASRPGLRDRRLRRSGAGGTGRTRRTHGISAGTAVCDARGADRGRDASTC